MMRFVRRVIFKDFGLKALALGISFFLWSAYASQPSAEVGYSVPIAFVNVPRNLTIANSAPTEVYLLIQGRAALMQTVRAADLAFTVDLSRASPGETSLPLTPQMATVPYGSTLLHSAPSELRISLVATSTPLPAASP